MNSFYYPKITSKITLIQTFDFSPLYVSIPHQKLKDRMHMWHMLVNQTFLCTSGSCRYKYLAVTNDEASVGRKYDETLICQIIDFLGDNIYIMIDNHLCPSWAPLLANLFLYSHEAEFLRSVKKSNKKLAKTFNSTSRCTDDLISINNPSFKQFLSAVSWEVVVSETSESRNVVLYIDLLINIWNGDLVSSTFDKERFILFPYCQFIWLIWEYSNSPSLWRIYLTYD